MGELKFKNEDLDVVIDMVRMYRAKGLSPDDCKQKLRRHATPEELDMVIKFITQDDKAIESTSLRANNDYFGWYEGPSDSKESHWGKLKHSLKTKAKPWSDDMISSLDRASTQVVSHLSPPKSETSIITKGLVLGHIQSGKTANFSATIAKAVDAGYKLIVVLAGMHNNLRTQTELRLRAELVDPHDGRTCTTLTGVDENGDFKSRQHVSANSQLSKINGFTLVVLKKNTSPLRNFSQWISEASPDVLERCPMLFIDDEADQASINTSKLDQDPTAINGHIRNLISKFTVATYVGYTATPFANVFVNSDLEEDIYPKDFLVSLDKPTTYFGPEEIFGRISSTIDKKIGMPIVRTIGELEAKDIKEYTKYGGEKHIFPSMITALKSFIIAGGIRLSRGHWKEHITMLVHISHLTAPQKKVKEALAIELDEIIAQILTDDLQLENELYMLWRKDYGTVTKIIVGKVDHEWSAVKVKIKEFVGRLEVILENSQSEQRLSFDKKTRDGEPFWGIVVGGNTLSRGLTLEGLTCSYFTRESKNYDTLLQMGRWFGYRPDYSDLVRIHTTEAIRDHFFNLATVEHEIREEIKLMSANKEKPEHVALRVRKIPKLNITSNNKMRSVRKSDSSYSGLKVQTYQLIAGNKNVIKSNEVSIKRFIDNCLKYGKKENIKFTDLNSSHLFEHVPSELIQQLLDTYKIPTETAKYDSKLMQKYITDMTKIGELQNWSVGLISRKSGEFEIDVSGLKVYPVKRRVKMYKQSEGNLLEAILSSVSTPGDEIIDLYTSFNYEVTNTDDVLMKGDTRLSDTQIRAKYRPNNQGLLLVYPLDSGLNIPEDEFIAEHQEYKPSYTLKAEGQMYAISIVFPHSRLSKEMSFVVNSSI